MKKGYKGGLSNNSGVTLTELMAVVSIILILMYLITAGIKSLYKKAESVQCSDNLRQMAVAIQLYVSDHDFLLPSPGRLGGDTWARKLINGEYVSQEKVSIFACPSMPAPRGYRINSGHKDASTWEHADDGDGGAKDLSTVEKPVVTILLSEYMNLAMDTGIDSNGTESFVDDTMWGGNYPSSQTHALLSVHNGGSNYLFVDFHVEWLTREEMLNDPNDYCLYEKP